MRCRMGLMMGSRKCRQRSDGISLSSFPLLDRKKGLRMRFCEKAALTGHCSDTEKHCVFL